MRGGHRQQATPAAYLANGPPGLWGFHSSKGALSTRRRTISPASCGAIPASGGGPYASRNSDPDLSARALPAHTNSQTSH
eukprot:scaffold569_cov408-Prasinococcus_capsulatus_cf.AAC.35